MARPIQATSIVWVRTSFAAGSAWRAGATTVRNITAPAVIAVAPKCIARTAIKGSLTPAPNQSIRLCLLADLKREAAVGGMRVDRKRTPCHMVGSAAARAQRDRHLVATDPA